MAVSLELLFIFFLILLNGFFVASEFALVAVRKTRIDELVNKGNSAAKLTQHAINRINIFISATQLGITVASLALGWIGEPTVAHILQQYMGFLPEKNMIISSEALTATIALLLITFFHIVIGELVPKTIALQRAEKTALLLIRPLTIFAFIFTPFVWILNKTGLLVLRLFGISSPSGQHQVGQSEEEIKMLLTQSGNTGIIAKDEVEMVYKVFQLGDTTVKQIMVPRTHIVSFHTRATLSEVITKIQKNPHSRFPVFKESINSINGFIHVKDIYKAALKINKKKKLSEITIIRKIITVLETKKADDVLLEMRRKRVHMAVVQDTKGKTVGIVTLEDVLESLVGEIQDEFEKPEELITK